MRAKRQLQSQTRRFFSVQLQSKRHQPPSVLYSEMVKNGMIMEDAKQMETCKELDRLYHQVVERINSGENGSKGKVKVQTTPEKGWKSWFSRSKEPEPTIPKSNIPGLFLFGLGGSGKTFLMDLMYEAIPSNKYRAHFHSFILEAHDRLHRQRMEKGITDMKQIAADIVEESEVNIFCFDELNPLDIGDAMALKLLFEGLVENGATLVATTKLPPDDIYKNGRSRDLFLPCIELLKQNCVIHHLDNEENYRMHADLEGDRYVVPNCEKANAYLDSKFAELTVGLSVEASTIEVFGGARKISVPRAAGVTADFTYSELFDNPTGAADYYALAANFRNIIIRDVRSITTDDLGVAKRFLTFLDIMYDHKVQCYFSSEKPALELFDAKVLQNSLDNALRLEDIKSRLCDMQSFGYRRSKYRVPQMKKIATPLAFKDLDGSGAIDLDEFISLCDTLGLDLYRNEMINIFEESDEDGNGTLDVDEVERMLMSRLTFKLLHESSAHAKV